MDSDEILERVDEYSLYCHYLGYEPIPHSGKYQSPIRTGENYDSVPSFGIFYTDKNPNREFLWKDQATGTVGDVFRLIQYMHGYPTMRDAEKRVIADFNLGKATVDIKDKIVQHAPPARLEIDIRVTPRDFLGKEVEWWSAINIDQKLLSIYNTIGVKYYWLAAAQTVPYAPREFAFAYRIWKQYQIYRPFEPKDNKFRNNFTDQHILGLLQLRFDSPLLVITKSMKDVMFFRSFGYEAISPRSENTPILERHLRALEKKYRHIVTWFDNDGKTREDYYPNYPHHQIPLDSGEKDPTDFCRHYGIRPSKSLLSDTLRRYL